MMRCLEGDEAMRNLQQATRIYMLKFFKRYELQWKAAGVIVWLLAAVWKIFFIDENEKNKNFQLFAGIAWGLLGIFYLFEVIDLIRKRKLKKTAKN